MFKLFLFIYFTKVNFKFYHIMVKTISKMYQKNCKLHVGGSGNDVSDGVQDQNDVQPIVRKISVANITDNTDEEQNYNHEKQSHDEHIENNVTLPWMDVSNVSLYTIPIDTVLYHGSQTVDTFDVQSLKLNIDTNVIFFSPNVDIAKSYIQDCSPTNPVGFVHKFVVIKPIDKIYIISANETRDVWNEDIVEKKFCNNIDHDSCRSDLHGIGFFVKETDTHNSEFALCKPLEFLEYQGRAHCTGARILSNDFEKK